MSDDDDAQAELLRQFTAAISGMDLPDLHRVLGDLSTVGGRLARSVARPELRRPPRERAALYRIRVDIDDAAPPIWRRLDLRSDVPLDVVHQVLQVAFDWTDSHLHRFSLGGHAFAPTSQLFLCPFDVDEGEDGDDGGIPAADVRLDETMDVPGDVLHYLYDYGDNWELTLRLEEVLPAADDAPVAVAVGGRRAAPPEDSGGGTDLASIALEVDDPAHFDVDELNQALRGPYFSLREHGIHERLVDMVNRLHLTPIGADLVLRTLALATESTAPSPDEIAAALRAHRWFLDRAADGGIQLTTAGYLKPADVEAAAHVVPAMGDWIGRNNRESNAAPLLDFRQALQSMGLLRKYKGALLLTRAGAGARRDSRKLWDLIAGKLIPPADGFETDATLLLLAYVATSADAEVPLEPMTEALMELGWRHRDGRRLDSWVFYRLRAFDTLINVTQRPVDRQNRGRFSPEAAALARAALRH